MLAPHDEVLKHRQSDPIVSGASVAVEPSG
jgi:hypothetical protein